MIRTPPPGIASPSKKRKASPEASVPGHAPTTPSRIPVRRLSTQPLSGRPSFASPTKASLSKHHPQILKRPSSAGTGAQRPGSRGRDVQNLFGGALGEVRPSVESNATPSKLAFETATPQRGSAHRRARSDGGGLSAKPRRMSRSPVKQNFKPSEQQSSAVDEMQENANPFVKRGLRRSPTGQTTSQPLAEAVLQDLQEQDVNPFQKKGLRRSPVSSQAAEAAGELLGRAEGFSKVTSSEPVVLPAGDTLGYSEAVPPRDEEYTTQSTEPITVNSSETRFPLNPRLPEVIEEPLMSTREEKHSPSRSRQRGRSSGTAEPVEEKIQTSRSNPRRPTQTADIPDLHTRDSEARLASRQRGNLPQAKDYATLSKERPRPRSSSESRELQVLEVSEPCTEQFESRPPSRQRGNAMPATTVLQEADQPRSRSASRSPRRQSHAAEPVNHSSKDQISESRSMSKSGGRVVAADEPIDLPAQRQSKILPPTPTRDSRSSQVADNIFRTRPQRKEPDLPPTPTQRGIPDPIVTTPPAGIHDTPSKRARRRAEKHKSSPLKPKDPQPAQTKATEPIDGPPVEKVRRRRSVRFLIPEDPHASKKKARDDLFKELQQLRADVIVTNQENERIRLNHGKKGVVKTPADSELLLNVLRRSIAPKFSATAPKPSIFKSIGSFLPFTSRRKRQKAFAALPNKPIPSHLPLKVDEPLPYLQIFSPLTYSSSITLLPVEAASPDEAREEKQPLLQHHLIKASHSSGLFSARLSMIVDSSLLSIVSLDIEKLPAKAEKELGTFMRARCNPDFVLNRDIGVIGWAMGQWVECSLSRARFWCAVEQEFGTAEARVKSAASNHQRKKRKRQQMIDEDVSEHGVNGEAEMASQKWTLRQLLPQMGRTSMEIGNDEVEMRFEWKVGFDWTGDVESSISASAELPRSWQAEDDRKSLKKIPESFDRLVKERGPLNAVRTVVGLLMPS